MARFQCTICEYIYDEEKEQKRWDELPEDWVCPLCGVPRSFFVELKEER